MKVTNKGDFFEVKLEKTTHEVTMAQTTYEELNNGRSKEELIEDCFKFLLEREGEESILRSFTIELIGKYFPEFKEEMKTRKYR